jgi:hypothetical protein
MLRAASILHDRRTRPDGDATRPHHLALTPAEVPDPPPTAATLRPISMAVPALAAPVQP